MEPLDAFDGEGVGAQTVDPRAHRDQAFGEVGDLGLARGVLDHRRAPGEGGGHQRILGRADGDEGEADGAAAKAAVRRPDLHIAAGQLDLGAEAFQCLQMKVDGPHPDRAAAWQRHGRLAGAGDQRSQHEDRGAHLADDVVGGGGRSDLGRAKGHHPAEFVRLLALDGGRHAELVQEVPEAVDVGEPRQVPERQRLVGEESAGQQSERGILGARNRQPAFEALAAPDDDPVHVRLL